MVVGQYFMKICVYMLIAHIDLTNLFYILLLHPLLIVANNKKRKRLTVQ